MDSDDLIKQYGENRLKNRGDLTSIVNMDFDDLSLAKIAPLQNNFGASSHHSSAVSAN